MPKTVKKNWLKVLFRVPQEESLIWGMIQNQYSFKGQILAVSGFMIILYFAYSQYIWGALAMMIAMYWHELGHHLVFMYNKITSIIVVIFPLGAVAAPKDKEEDARSDLLPWWNIGWMLLAGPTMNMIAMLGGLAMMHFNFLPTLGYELVFINGLLGAFNLLPLGDMDGGQFFHVIFSTLKEKYDVFVAILGIAVSVAIIGAIFYTSIGLGFFAIVRTLLQNSGLVFFLILMATGLWHKQGKDNPLHWKSPQAMTIKQVAIQLTYYLALVAVTLFLLTLI